MINLKNNQYKVLVILLFMIFLFADPLHVFPLKSNQQEAVEKWQNVKDNFQDEKDYRAILTEEGDNYNLTFEGTFFNEKRINGQLTSFKPAIEVSRIGNGLYIKDKNNQWVDAHKLELGGLLSFLKTPWEVLSLFLDLTEKEIIIDDENLIVKCLSTGNNAQLLKELFPHLPARSNKQLMLTLILGENGLHPYSIAIKVIDSQTDEIFIKRYYELYH